MTNKTVNAKQYTVIWYVDDAKILHVDPAVVTSILLGLEKRFGKLSINRGKQHTFVGMSINLNNNKTIILAMGLHQRMHRVIWEKFQRRLHHSS